jgi:signal recognition particle receptor subunit beta
MFCSLQKPNPIIMISKIQSYTLAIVGAEPQEREIIASVLTLATSSLEKSWRVVADEDADCVMLVNDRGELWDAYYPRFGPDRIVAYVDPACRHPARWILPNTGKRIPSLQLVAPLFKAIGECFASLLRDDWFVPDDYLLGAIRKGMADGLARRCTIPMAVNLPELIIVPARKAFFTTAELEDLKPYYQERIESIDIEAIDEDKLEALITAPGMRRHSLTQLLWLATLVGSRGRLLAGCDPSHPVHLKWWPEFSRLPYYGEFQKLFNVMNRHGGTIATIAEQSGAPLHKAIEFLNACVVLGLVELGASARTRAQRIAEARHALCEHFTPIAEALQGKPLKVMFTGSVGVGKTSAIITLSDEPPLLTEALPSDNTSELKHTTTIVMDYGKIYLPDGTKLHLYGTPGQKRFEFMGTMFSRTAWGLVILLNNSLPDPFDDLRYYLDLYRPDLSKLKVVVGITHTVGHPTPDVRQYREFLSGQGFDWSVLACDTRVPEDTVRLLCALK